MQKMQKIQKMRKRVLLAGYDYFKRCWPARPAPAGFFSKMDFTPAPVSQIFSSDKDKILQDVSSLLFYPKTHSVDSLFRIPTFFLLTDFLPKNSKTPKTCFC